MQTATEFIIVNHSPNMQPTINSTKLFTAAKASLGKLLSDGNAELGCAITVNNIAIEAWGQPVGGGASTNLMFAALQETARFTKILLADVMAGDIIISPTGFAKDPASHGHVGIVAQFGILSNSSEDGRVHEQWTIPAWYNHYVLELGFPMDFFRAV